jgi:SNF family Na+-dependent transporter
MAGFTIFGILGNLAHELGTDDISNVVRGGSGLAFISYPDAIAKFTLFPQVLEFDPYCDSMFRGFTDMKIAPCKYCKRTLIYFTYEDV